MDFACPDRDGHVVERLGLIRVAIRHALDADEGFNPTIFSFLRPPGEQPLYSLVVVRLDRIDGTFELLKGERYLRPAPGAGDAQAHGRLDIGAGEKLVVAKDFLQ